MTRPRYDAHSTEFGLWLRNEKCIDSSLGFVTTNIDYIWENYKTREWMLIEEKRFNGKITWSQEKQFEKIHNAINDINYKGFYLLVFEKTSPSDGYIKLNNTLITEQELKDFLLFVTPRESYFQEALCVQKG